MNEGKESSGESRLLSKQATVERLGVSKTGLWRLEKRGLLVPVRIGGKPLYVEREVEEFIEALRRERTTR